jgi:hypothetical protein
MKDNGNEKDKKLKGKGMEGKHDNKIHITSLKDVVTDNNPSHSRWRIKEDENLSKTFCFNSKKMPESKGQKNDLHETFSPRNLQQILYLRSFCAHK